MNVSITKTKDKPMTIKWLSMLRFITVMLLFALSSSSCAPLVRAGQTTRTDFINFHAGESIGQTFTARYRGLSGIQLFLKPGEQSTGTLSLKLHPGSQDPQIIALSTLKAEEVRSPAYYHFYFEPQPSSNNHDYYFSLDFQGEGTIQVGTAPGSSYLDGALYHNDLPLDLQTNFLLVYDPIQTVIGLILMAVTWVWYLLISVFLFIIPGWAFLSLLWKRNQSIHLTEKAALSVGLSLAIYPVLYLWTNLIGLRLGYLYAVLLPSLSLIWLLWKASATFRTKGFSLSRNNFITSWDNQPDWGTLARHLPTLSLLVVLALVFAVRFWVIRTLDVPMWGDSYQHTMIAQLLVDNRSLFSSWEPYAELQTFTYHFGFHSLVAVFHYISQLPMPQATLWTGQILNGLAVFSLYPLANRLGGNRWSGVVAVLIAGLLVPMPMYYVNWGRYTQLAGQVILPITVFLLWKAMELKNRDRGLIIITWIALGGLALTHYRVLIFAVIFIVAFMVISLRRKNASIILTNISLISLGAGLVFLPWFLRVFTGRIMAILGAQLSTPASVVSDLTWQYNVIGNLFTYLPSWVWLLLPIIMGWGFWLKKIGLAVVGIWWLLIFWAANPSWLGLPGDGALSNFAVFIATYIPAGLVLGASVGWLEDRHILEGESLGRGKPLYSFLMLFAVFIVGIWGFTQRVRDLDVPKHVLVTRPDVRVAQWIQDNLPEEARFLVNSFTAYRGSVIVGSDGGWWLPLLANRQINVPPLNYGSEHGPISDYRSWITYLGHEIELKGHTHPDLLVQYHERGFSHVYIGQQRGRVNHQGPTLDPQTLLANPLFEPIYNQDRVWIFQFNFP
jgi:hypothetical protein